MKNSLFVFCLIVSVVASASSAMAECESSSIQYRDVSMTEENQRLKHAACVEYANLDTVWPPTEIERINLCLERTLRIQVNAPEGEFCFSLDDDADETGDVFYNTRQDDGSFKPVQQFTRTPSED